MRTWHGTGAPATMRAMQLAAPAPVAEAPLRLVELPVPAPGPGEVLLRVLACGVCRTDLHILEGELPPHRSPVVPGHQIVGEVVALGRGAELVAPGGEPGAPALAAGDRVGVPWLHRTDGSCRFCARGRENLCEHALFTGWDVDGGFAEYTVAPAGFVYRLPAGMTAMAAAPLLCAGIIGYRCLRLVGIVGDDAALPGGVAASARRRRVRRRRARGRPCVRAEAPRHLRLRLGRLAVHAGRHLARLGGVRDRPRRGAPGDGARARRRLGRRGE